MTIHYSVTGTVVDGVLTAAITDNMARNAINAVTNQAAWAQSSISGGLGGIVYVKPKL